MYGLDHRSKVVWVSLELDPDRKGAVRRVALRRHRAMYGVMALGICLAASIVAGAALVVMGMLAPGLHPLIGLLVLLLTLIGASVGLGYLQRWFFVRHFGGRLLLAGLCACCDYDLKAVRPEPDGCRICPECGAAWKLPE